MFGWGRGLEGRIEPQTGSWRGLRRQMIYSSGGGGGAQKVWETGPRSHSVLRKGLGASRSAVFWILTPPCTIGACAPAGNTCSHHAKVLDPRPPLHGRSLAVSTFPARTGSGHQVCPGQGRLLPECSRAQRGQQHGLVSDHCSLGPAGHLAASESNWGGPDSPSGSGRGAAITRLAGGRGEVRRPGQCCSRRLPAFCGEGPLSCHRV